METFKKKTILSLLIAFVLSFTFIGSANAIYTDTLYGGGKTLKCNDLAKVTIYFSGYKHSAQTSPWIRIDRNSGSKTWIVSVDDPNGNRIVKSKRVTGKYLNAFGNKGKYGTYTLWIRNEDGSALNHYIQAKYWTIDVN